MTFSIVARDPATGDLGIALASKFLAAGSITMYAHARVGAVVTQALANTRYGPDGLVLLGEGRHAQEVVEALTDADENRAHRQLGVVDAAGRAATYSGEACLEWAGDRLSDGVAAQGNILVGPSVVDAMVEAFRGGGPPFPELLVRALAAGDAEGGDRRGRQAAALLVVREGGGYGGLDDRWIDLRVDDHATPITELERLLELTRLYRDRPPAEDLLPIDETLAGELRRHLAALGYDHQQDGPGRSLAAAVESEGITRTGTPRPLPPGWDDGWEAALSEWMAVENLEERLAASGWIDPRVLAFLRHRSGG
ncbi:MAG: DUF1028 domain-containing protein [Chloroflexota bacterium]|nr:DUF1028 domain-containing protein [Chloroflexota bacterium]